LKKKIKSGKLTKQHINNRGYNKFLVLEGVVEVKIDETKMKDDAVWDGLKGYVTNTKLEPAKVVENYGHLWQIEKAFRISKSDLAIRPIFHRVKRRIEAHICIAFVAYTIYKELERLLAEKKVTMSAKRAAELTHTMYEMEYVLPHSKRTEKTRLKNDDEQQTLYEVIHR
jgi:transposase